MLYPPSPKGDHSIAVVETRGRYPQTGVAYNDICTETVYLLEGQLRITLNGKETVLDPGDLCMILPNIKYSIEGIGKAMVLITPQWDSNQNHHIS